MGYGEYGGGGSVQWTVVHGGDDRAENGRDPEPSSSSGFNQADEFIVVIDGKEYRTRINGKEDQIQIYWPPHDPRKSDKMKELEPKINEGRRRNKEAHRAAGGPVSEG